MAKRKREAGPHGFHALQKKIHDLEETDRALERERNARPDAYADMPEEAFERRAPQAHEE